MIIPLLLKQSQQLSENVENVPNEITIYIYIKKYIV